MRIFKTKSFAKWTKTVSLSDSALKKAIEEVENGLVDADLWGGVLKKRIALGNRGKSGGVRALLVYKGAGKAFCIYGFAKNERANISATELNALKLYAEVLLSLDATALKKAIAAGELVEVT